MIEYDTKNDKIIVEIDGMNQRMRDEPEYAKRVYNNAIKEYKRNHQGHIHTLMKDLEMVYPKFKAMRVKEKIPNTHITYV